MPLFAYLTFFGAFSIEILGTIISVIGLSTLFGANPIIIALAISLDVGKLLVVTLLYSYWRELPKTMRAYALIASLVTMTITSAGAAGYLSGEFQKAVLGTQEISLKVDVLKQEQQKLEARKKQIDDSIASLPEKFSASQRIRMIAQFKEEQRQVTDRLMALSKELPEMQVSQIGVEAKAGPILYISKAFNISVEEAVKYVVGMIIFVFDPLAVFLILAGNFLLDQRKKPQTPPASPEPKEPEVPQAPVEAPPVHSEPKAEEPIIAQEPSAPASPGVAEAVFEAPPPAVQIPKRPEITLTDLKHPHPIHQSVLGTVGDDNGSVHFDAAPQPSNDVVKQYMTRFQG